MARGEHLQSLYASAFEASTLMEKSEQESWYHLCCKFVLFIPYMLLHHYKRDHGRIPRPSLLVLCFLIIYRSMQKNNGVFYLHVHAFLLFLCSFYLIDSNSSSSSSVHQPICHDRESSALLRFRQSFLIDEEACGDPSSYPKVTTWKSHAEKGGSNCCSWDGVECDKETGHVIGLHLARSCLFGSINSSSTLFSLVHLHRLDLSNNHFNSSEIPSAVGQLSRLRSLDLSYSVFSGQIPLELLALSKLVFLDLSGNPGLQLQMVGFRNLVQNLTHLKKLHLYQVNISSTIPHEMANLSSLASVNLRECGLHGEFPVNIFRLPNLLDISVRFNQDLMGYLPEFQETSQLQVLYLGHTSFSGELPASIGKLGSLTDLSINSCNFTGLIPSSFGRLSQLSLLDLSNNSLRGQIPNSLFELANLGVLSLYRNHLNGTVELAMLAKLKNLFILQLSHNRLSLLNYNDVNVTLPEFQILRLDECNFTEIPKFLQNQNELKMLGLSENNIHGPVPKWIWNVSKQSLELLDLGENFLTSFDPPAGVLPWSRLRILDIGSNLLQGSLPIPLSSMYSFQAGGNKLFGQIPHLICNMSSLLLLDLSNNNLSGRIPQCLTNLSSSLSLLSLRGNNLHGSIPQTCTSTSSLRMMDLSGNQLQGQIPRSLANCLVLEQVNLGNNRIKDIFPFWLGALPRLQILILSSNLLHGVIESSETKFEFSNLRIIDLSSNEFVGDLPSKNFKNWGAMKLGEARKFKYMENYSKFRLDIYKLNSYYAYSMTITNKSMQRFYEKIPDTFIAIDFSNNHFSGQIPTSIGNLNGLHLLNLGGNNLTGHIPSSLGNLTRMESLDLSLNKLSGEIPFELTRMTFLAFFNVSHNQLTGLIPQGKQFATFSNASFDGNPGLCGRPLSRGCGSSEASPPAPSSSKQGSTSKFDWKVVLMAYGSGLVIGASVGYCLTSWKHGWFVKTFGRRQRKRMRKEKRGHGRHMG